MTYRLYTFGDKFIKTTDVWPRSFTGIIEWSDGSRQWNVGGYRHRLDGPAYIGADDTKYWFRDGKRHRTDGPAVEHVDGEKHWFVDGKHHRLDGPAIESPVGHCSEWWVDGVKVTEEHCELLYSIMKLRGLL